jgi:hypothetical protein
MIKLIDTIDVTATLNELAESPEHAWTDTKPWSNPEDYGQSTLSREGTVDKKSVIREQDRLHVIWQADEDGKNNNWWKDPNWRALTPVITEHGKKFPTTIQQLAKFWKDKNKIIERMFFSRLRPGQQIYPHSDATWGENFDVNSRYGLVITTNSQCKITAQDAHDNPEPGTIFWFDNTQQHSAINNGNTDRIYLYMDVKNQL